MPQYEIPAGFTIGLVASMPRSGTWYSFYFLEFLDLYLSGRSQLSTRLDLEIYHSMNLAKIHVHTICPGFLEAYDDRLRQRWDTLQFYVPGYNFGYQKFVADNRDVYSPVTNPHIRIIYLYRNPLDQSVSYFRHSRHNINELKRSYLDQDDNEVEIRDERHFLRAVGLEAFIKQYFTFHVMNRRLRGNVLLVNYEALRRNPADTFSQMLGHLGFQVDDDNKKTCFRKALQSSSMTSLKNIEVAIKGTLARDQSDKEESHMRGGEIGKWKDYYDQSDLDFVEARLDEFGLQLDSFVRE